MKIFVAINLLIGTLFLNSCIEPEIPLAGTTWIAIDNNCNSLYLVSFLDTKIAYIIKDDLADGQILNAIIDYFGYGIITMAEYVDDVTESYVSWLKTYDYYNGFRGSPMTVNFPENIFSEEIDWHSSRFSEYETINVGTHMVSGKKDNQDWKFVYSIEKGVLSLELSDELNPKKYGTQFSKRLVGNNASQPIGIWTNDTGEYFFFTNSDVVKKWGMGTYVSWDYTSDGEYITWSGNKDGGKKPYSIESKNQQIKLILPGDLTVTTLRRIPNKFVIIF